MGVKRRRVVMQQLENIGATDERVVSAREELMDPVAAIAERNLTTYITPLCCCSQAGSIEQAQLTGYLPQAATPRKQTLQEINFGGMRLAVGVKYDAGCRNLSDEV
jgi:hypothetical protein